MKSIVMGFVLILTIFVYLDTASALSAAEAEALQKKVKEACIKESSLSDDEIKRVNEDKVVSQDSQTASKNLQCYVLCYYKKIGLIDTDGKQKVDAIMQYMDHMITDKASIKPKLEKCAAIKGDNACEVVYNFEKCVFA